MDVVGIASDGPQQPSASSNGGDHSAPDKSSVASLIHRLEVAFDSTACTSNTSPEVHQALEHIKHFVVSIVTTRLDEVRSIITNTSGSSASISHSNTPPSRKRSRHGSVIQHHYQQQQQQHQYAQTQSALLEVPYQLNSSMHYINSNAAYAAQVQYMIGNSSSHIDSVCFALISLLSGPNALAWASILLPVRCSINGHIITTQHNTTAQLSNTLALIHHNC
jgi:hypothetical protein